MEKSIKIKFLSIGFILGIIVTFLSVSLLSTNGKTEPATVEVKESEHEEHSEFIELSDSVMKEFGVEISVAGPGEIEMHKDLTGEIIPNPYNVAHIVPRFAGIVKAVYKKIGDRVKKGDKIALIESNESLVQYNVTSSIDGTILELHMTPGELIGDENHVVTIANLRNVWAELNVYQKDLGDVKVGQIVEVRSPHTNSIFRNRLFYLSPTVNEATRTAIARVALKNVRGLWKPGMFVSGKVFTSVKKVNVSVPKNSVQIMEGQKVVFVKSEKGFSPRVVTIGLENDKAVEILEGLHPGEEYISKGAFTFKSEILKESFGGDEH